MVAPEKARPFIEGGQVFTYGRYDAACRCVKKWRSLCLEPRLIDEVILTNLIAIPPTDEPSLVPDPLDALNADMMDDMEAKNNVELYRNLYNIEDIKRSSNSTKRKRSEDGDGANSKAIQSLYWPMYGHYFLESPGSISYFTQSILRGYDCCSVFQLVVYDLRSCLCDICLLCTNGVVPMSMVAHIVPGFWGRGLRLVF
ncbi:hypothetical protein Cgig2_003204 [Carnegiea gigantea]|uniref:Uncharacterized protein n=1 Tax=Carnegiea gigantea TaxID=171969 RepID=A0A9Q1K4Y9_9CARY|nr:hypothetical protein Cgig2_003204 [Carnegiea gigantea]